MGSGFAFKRCNTTFKTKIINKLYVISCSLELCCRLFEQIPMYSKFAIIVQITVWFERLNVITRKGQCIFPSKTYVNIAGVLLQGGYKSNAQNHRHLVDKPSKRKYHSSITQFDTVLTNHTLSGTKNLLIWSLIDNFSFVTERPTASVSTRWSPVSPI